MSRTARILAATLAALGLACARQDHQALRCRDLTPPGTPGWARVVLDAAAQRDTEGLWISDAAGRSVPFLRVHPGLWSPQPLALARVNLGRDGQGRPAAEFEVQVPAGWQVGERARLRLDLDLAGEGSWVAAVEAARQRPGGAFLTFDGARERIYDLAPSGSRTSFHLPWDGTRYRIVLRAEQGRAPRITGLQAWAETPPEAVAPEVRVAATVTPQEGSPGAWRVDLGGTDRIAGLDVELAPPAAPLRAEVAREGEGSVGSGMLWNLPALDSRATHLDLAPVLARSLILRLPEGARPVAVSARLRREVLLFPAEAGQAYRLHLGGTARPAPGDLGALPSSRVLLAGRPLALGPEAPDPDGLPRRVAAGERARPWMPWVAGLAVLLLAWMAWRLLQGEGTGPS